LTVFYLDTSAFLKRFKTEPGSDVVATLFDGSLEAEILTTSYYTVLEVIGVARRLLKGRALTRRAYSLMMSRFLTDIQQIVVQPVNDELVASAVDLADRYALRAGDALQLATALAVNAALPEDAAMVVVASDKDLVEACAVARIEALNPETGEAGAHLIGLRPKE